MVQLTTTTRFDPRRIFECTAKLFASASVRRQPGLTRVASDSATKRTPRVYPMGTEPVLPASSLRVNRGAFLLNSTQLRILGFTLAAISELTREVFLPDQSEAHIRSSHKCWQELFPENPVEICACLWKITALRRRGMSCRYSQNTVTTF